MAKIIWWAVRINVCRLRNAQVEWSRWHELISLIPFWRATSQLECFIEIFDFQSSGFRWEWASLFFAIDLKSFFSTNHLNLLINDIFTEALIQYSVTIFGFFIDNRIPFLVGACKRVLCHFITWCNFTLLSSIFTWSSSLKFCSNIIHISRTANFLRSRFDSCKMHFLLTATILLVPS